MPASTDWNAASTRDAVQHAARLLRNAEETGQAIAPIRGGLPELDVDAAYAVQLLGTQHGRAAGRRIAGRKIGLTSQAVQNQLGVRQPDFGVLWADLAFSDYETVPWSAVMQPRAEAEIAFVLESDIDVERPGFADLVRAIGYAVPAIEVVGSRIADWDIGIVDTIADNASGGAFVLGGTPHRLAGLDLTSIRMRLERDGVLVSAGSGRDCLGHPLSACVWLARKVASIGEPLRAGEVILSGALGPLVVAEPGSTFRADIGTLGSVYVTLGPAEHDNSR